jgi:hypothetical protein
MRLGVRFYSGESNRAVVVEKEIDVINAKLPPPPTRRLKQPDHWNSKVNLVPRSLSLFSKAFPSLTPIASLFCCCIMGASFFFPSTRRHDRIEIFDYTSLLIDGRLLKSVQAPACLEELVDWTKSANLMIRDMPDMIQLNFRPYIKTSYRNNEPGSDLSSVSQISMQHLEGIAQRVRSYCFLRMQAGDFTFCHISFLTDLHFIWTCQHQVVIIGEGSEAGTVSDSTQKKSVISVPDFCIYYMLLRRYSEIMDIGRPTFLRNGSSSPECGICMSQADEVVLPCAHSMCSTCAMKWVEVHANCPFCRYHYDDLKRLERDQWQVG